MLDKLIFRDCVFYDGYLYFVAEYPAGIPLRVNLENKEISLWEADDMSSLRMGLYDRMIEKDGIVYAVTSDMSVILEYKIREHKVSSYDTGFSKVDIATAHMDICDGKLLVFGREDGMIVFDIKNKNCNFIEYGEDSKKYLTGISKGGECILFSFDGLYRLVYNTKKNEITKERNGQCFDDVIHVVNDEESVFVLQKDGRIFECEGDTVTELSVDFSEVEEENRSFMRLCVTKDNFFLLPFIGEKIVSVCKKEKKARVIHNYPKDYRYEENDWAKYYGYAENEDCACFAPRKSNYFPIIDKGSSKIKWVKAEVDEAFSFKFHIMSNKLVYEADSGDLTKLIEAIRL